MEPGTGDIAESDREAVQLALLVRSRRDLEPLVAAMASDPAAEPRVAAVLQLLAEVDPHLTADLVVGLIRMCAEAPGARA
jgi:hypothetical protein